jgi:cholera toxin transcriptional activator
MLNWRSLRMSSTSPLPPRIARFGIYEVNFALGELRKNGVKVRLQEQPLQVLAVLLEKPGEVVTREDLRSRLWNPDTFVDFDHSLNTAINKLRDALDDSAANPRFVETLAKRGYRFIAPVHHSRADVGPGRMETPAIAGGHVLATGCPDTESDLPLVPRGWPRSLFAITQTMYLVFYVLALVRYEALSTVAVLNLAPIPPQIVATLALLTAAVGIPLRFYLLSGVAFDHPRLRKNFQRIFVPILLLDLLWAFAPFLILDRIGTGGAVAACAALLYVPFGERTLIRMAYPNHTRPG